jgi:hypothetical protein
MKKIFSFLIFMLAGWSCVQAQTSGAVVTTIPSSFTAEDQVKIIVDVSNVPNLKDREPLYVWTWEPGDPSPGNGNWDNSNEGRKMTKEGPNRWSWTMTPTQFYGKTPAEVAQISFLVKAKDGSGDRKTDDIHLAVAPLVFVPTAFRVFPKIVSKSDMLTIFLDQVLATDINTQRMTPQQAKISVYAGNTQIDVEKTVNLTQQGAKLYSYSFLPTKLFTIPNNTLITKMRVVFKGKGKDANGNDIDLESIIFEYGFDDLK